MVKLRCSIAHGGFNLAGVSFETRLHGREHVERDRVGPYLEHRPGHQLRAEQLDQGVGVEDAEHLDRRTSAQAVHIAQLQNH